MSDLISIAKEIRTILENRRKEIDLTFIEEKHVYFMRDIDGKIKKNFPSVSKVYKQFFKPFDAEAKSLEMVKGDVAAQKQLLKEWREKSNRSTNLGSRTHYELEKLLIEKYEEYKDIRYPIFKCDEGQIRISDNMVNAGIKYINLMHERGAILLDTEIVSGDPELGYTGQPDKGWIMLNQKQELGLVVTDWKTNSPKSFIPQWYTDKMYSPFEKYDNTDLTHYYIQIPLYGRLLQKMLQNSKYENLKFFGGVIVLLKEDGSFEEFKIPQDIINKVFSLNIRDYAGKN